MRSRVWRCASPRRRAPSPRGRRSSSTAGKRRSELAASPERARSADNDKGRRRMKRGWIAALALLGACATQTTPAITPPAAETAPAPLSAEALLAHVRVLSSDEFGGRGPGTPGETLT